MSGFEKCPVCKEYGWFGAKFSADHTCKPVWECRAEWQDDDYWAQYHATEASDAAAKFAEHYDCDGGDYAIVSNKMRDDVIVLVRKPGDENFKRFEIEAEAIPTYRATEVDEPSPYPQVTEEAT